MTGDYAAMRAHTSRDFESELRELRAQTLAMGARCERALQLAMKAFLEGSAEVAADVEALDRRIDQDEMDIDALVLRMLALRQPVAYDLRLLTGAMRIATDLERIGDEAVNIAERALDGTHATAGSAEDDLRSMAEQVERMLRGALDAFANSDALRADQVLLGDDGVDALYGKILRHRIAALSDRAGQDVVEGIRIMQVSKCLERIADHATSLAEEIIFIVRAEDVRHPPIQ